MSEKMALEGEVGGESEKMSDRVLLFVGGDGVGGVEGGVSAIVRRK